MSRPIDQALSNLIPRYSGQLPHELVQLANGLLAQSRLKASNLKAEEEVGRAYACANIACERLKVSLNLPSIEPRPPVAPRVYKNLYSYLDRALTKSSTPRKSSQGPLHSTLGGTSVQKSLPQRHTPSKEKTLEAWRNGNRTEKAGLKHGNNKERELPDWIVYVIRLLCRQMQTRKAIPHVIAGVESVLYLTPPQKGDLGKGKQKEEKTAEQKIPAIIAAVWFFASCRMLGKDLDGDEYVARRDVVLDVLKEMDEDEKLKEKIENDQAAKDGWVQVGEADLRVWLNELADKGWIDLDWFLNIQHQEVDGVVEEVDGDEVQWYSTRSREELRKAGLGSMVIRQYDFGSEENRKAYKQWKKQMLIKVDEMIRDGALDV